MFAVGVGQMISQWHSVHSFMVKTLRINAPEMWLNNGLHCCKQACWSPHIRKKPDKQNEQCKNEINKTRKWF